MFRGDGDGYAAAVTSRIAVLAVDASDPALLAEFWCRVLGWEVREQEDGNISIGTAAGEAAWSMDLLQVPEAKTVKNRLHLDLRADGTGTDAELERLLALGARRVDVGQEPDVSWTVLADPEGNEFCLLSRTVQQRAAT